MDQVVWSYEIMVSVALQKNKLLGNNIVGMHPRMIFEYPTPRATPAPFGWIDNWYLTVILIRQTRAVCPVSWPCCYNSGGELVSFLYIILKINKIISVHVQIYCVRNIPVKYLHVEDFFNMYILPPAQTNKNSKIIFSSPGVDITLGLTRAL